MRPWPPYFSLDSVCLLVFFSAVGCLTVTLLQRGATQKQAWMIFLVPVAIDIQLLTYYGNLLLILINKFPFLDSCDSFLEIFWRLPCFTACGRISMDGKAKGMPLVYPIADLIGYSAISLAEITAVNPELTNWITQFAGLASWILAIPFVWIVAQLVAIDSSRGKTAASGARDRARPAQRQPLVTG